MKERIDNSTPENITNLFNLPYRYFLDNQQIILDCACGNKTQYEKLSIKSKIFGVDKQEDLLNNVIGLNLNDSNLKLPFENNFFDIVVSFETIEHLDRKNHLIFLNELLRVSKKDVIVGSVSTDGPNYIYEDLIFKKSLRINKFHKYEYSSWEWKKFFESNFKHVNFFHSVLENDDLIIKPELNGNKGFCNYVKIEKENK